MSKRCKEKKIIFRLCFFTEFSGSYREYDHIPFKIAPKILYSAHRGSSVI